MFLEFIVLFLFSIISLFLIVNAHIKVRGAFKSVDPTELVSLDLLSLVLKNSNAYNFLPTGAKIHRIVQHQIEAGLNFKNPADAVVKEAAETNSTDAHRTLQHEFDAESIEPGACE